MPWSTSSLSDLLIINFLFSAENRQNWIIITYKFNNPTVLLVSSQSIGIFIVWFQELYLIELTKVYIAFCLIEINNNVSCVLKKALYKKKRNILQGTYQTKFYNLAVLAKSEIILYSSKYIITQH